MTRSLYPFQLDPLLLTALTEDLGQAGDLTTDAVVGPQDRARGRFHFRDAGRVAGMAVVRRTFALLDGAVTVAVHHDDGADVAAGTCVATVEGPARAVLTGERVALNLLARLSAIATTTARAVAVAAPHGCRIACTRKTTPGLRGLEKHAVRVGGGTNHRFGLDDGVLIKDNHIVVAGGVGAALTRARQTLGHMVKIEVEVDTLDQLDEVLALGLADAVLLDNMGPDRLREAVGRVDGRLTTEASGGITFANLADVAATGVDLISLGALTHSVPALDIGLDFEMV